MPPMISIVGKSGSGKTTFLEGLIHEISSHGYKIATIKHTHHELNFDHPGKDSWRHARAGAIASMVSSSSHVQIIKPVEKDITLEELAQQFGEDYDLILTEGFSAEGSTPKIEIHRKDANLPLLKPKNLVAVVTDEPLAIASRQFDLYDIKGVARFIEGKYLKSKFR